ncbi:MAG: helicase-associated domain-containing protein [Micrococcales bacterium]|nr:helicase-associated domain-containing protein [Micrococcales bacterium]
MGGAQLVALLRRRPDLATPPPVTLASLAARATSRASLERALAGVDAGVLQVVEAVVALTPDGPPSRERVVAAVAGSAAPSGADDRALVGCALDEAVALALVWPDGAGLHAAPGLADMLGPYPAGLAPATPPGAGGARAGTGRSAPSDERRTRALAAVRACTGGGLDDSPAGARAVLDALAWGPPVGLVPPPGTPTATAVTWLLDAGLLTRGGPRQVVLPREVSLALRGGRTHRAAARPPVPSASPRDPAVVAAESANAAERMVRLIARLVAAWGSAPPGVLRTGGLGVRELRALARDLDVDEREAALVVELAYAAGLIADDGEEHPSFVPTDDADAWERLDPPGRWARLATAWLTTERAPWLVGTRGERGAARGALEPDLRRGWAPHLRSTVLRVLAAAPEGGAVTPEDVRAALRWRTPRHGPPADAVAAVLREAALTGVTGAGALSPAGRAALTSPDDLAAVAAALAATLPAPIDEVLLQGDLTGIVPGRPAERLATLLERTAVVESRGGALTVRFTPESVQGALDAGASADQVLAGLNAVARTGVPQPLEYLVRDAARRHGRLRAGPATSYLRADDAALLAGLPDDPRLARLGLRALAPTVLVATAPTAELVAALRERGLAPVVEGPDGLVVRAAGTVRRTRPRSPRPEPPPDDETRLTALATRLRRTAPAEAAPEPGDGEPATEGGSNGAPVPGRPALDHPALDHPALDHPATATGHGHSAGAPDAGDVATVVMLLREAGAEHRSVWVDVVGARGELERRLLRPVSVDGGRLRAVDPARETELVVALHRVAAVENAS